MADDRKFREVHDYAAVHGFVGGFPVFRDVHLAGGSREEAVLLSETAVESREVSVATFGNLHVEDVPELFRAANAYAAQEGYPAAFPNGYRADFGSGLVYGAIMIKPDVVEVRDVPDALLGVANTEDVQAMMRAVADYATRNRFAAGLPMFLEPAAGRQRVVLFAAGQALRRAVPADLLRMYSSPKPRWGVVLCQVSDIPPIPNARDRWRNFFTAAGRGTGEAYDYWRDISYGLCGLDAVQVFGWINLGHTRAEVQALPNNMTQRQRVYRWGLDAARASQIDLSQFEHKIVVVNLTVDHGNMSYGGDVVFGYEDTRSLEPTFIFHEMGHAFGLDDSFGETATPAVNSRYGDPFDIMSAMNVYAFTDAANRVNGPSMNAASRQSLGWLHRSRVKRTGMRPLGETITLASVNRPDVDGYLMAEFSAPGRDPAQTVASTYTVEYREPAGWDRGFVVPHVMVHEIRNDAKTRLLTNSNQGLLDFDPLWEFVAPTAGVVVRLLEMSPTSHQARLRVWTPPPNAKRALRIHEVIYGPRVEHVVIQNDTSLSLVLTDWTLRDSSNHLFTFPAFTLEAGFSVRVWTRAGTNDAENVYWGYPSSLWTKKRGKVTLRDRQGTVISMYGP